MNKFVTSVSQQEYVLLGPRNHPKELSKLYIEAQLSVAGCILEESSSQLLIILGHMLLHNSYVNVNCDDCAYFDVSE